MVKGKSFKRMLLLLVMLFALAFIVACADDNVTPDPNGNGAADADGNGNEVDANDNGAAATEDGTGEGDEGLEREIYRISLLLDGALGSIWNTDETVIGQVLKEELGIVFEFDFFAGDITEQQALMLAAGDYGELMSLRDNDMVARYINAGAAIRLDGFLPDAPYFVDRYRELIPFWRMLCDDGYLYKWEGSTHVSLWGVPQFDKAVRIDALEAMGWPRLETEDDWIEFVRGALEIFPETNDRDTLGFTWSMDIAAGPTLAVILFERAQFTNAARNNAVIFDNQNDVFVDYLSVPTVKEALQFWNRVFREGLFDREAFTDNYDNMMQKMNVGQAIVVQYVVYEIPGVNAMLTAAGNEHMHYIGLPMLLDSQRGLPRYITVETVRPLESMVITDRARYPERLMEFMNFISSPEGATLLGWGIEGVHYTMEDGRRVPTEYHVNGVDNDLEWGARQGFNGWGWFGQPNIIDERTGQSFIQWQDPFWLDRGISARQREALEAYGWESTADPWFADDSRPIEPFDLSLVVSSIIDPDSEEGRLETRITELRNSMVPLLIMADSEETFDAMWAQLMEDHLAMNPQRVVDAYNAIYAENRARFDELAAR